MASGLFGFDRNSLASFSKPFDRPMPTWSTRPLVVTTCRAEVSMIRCWSFHVWWLYVYCRGSNEMQKTYRLLVQSYSITRLPSPSFACWERPTIYPPFWKDETRPCAIKQKSGLPLPLLHVPNLSCPATRKTGCGPHLQQKTNLTNVLTYPPRFPQMFNASSSFSLSKSPFWVDSPLVKHTQIS